MDYNYLGEILQEARTKLGLKQSDVALKIGCTSSNISSWERGKSKIDIESLINLCEIYNIDFVSVLKKVSDTHNSSSDLHKQKLIKNYRILNPRGRKKLVEYSEDLVCSGNYSDTVIASEAARTTDNRKSVKATQMTQEELSIFDTAPQSDEKL